MNTHTLPVAQQIVAASGWDELTRQLMLAGKALPDIPPELKVAENQVPGCQSRVWLTYDPVSPPALCGFSEAKIIRGVLAILLEKANSLPMAARGEYDFEEYLKILGVSRNISQSRADGVAQIIRQIKQMTS